MPFFLCAFWSTSYAELTFWSWNLFEIQWSSTSKKQCFCISNRISLICQNRDRILFSKASSTAETIRTYESFVRKKVLTQDLLGFAKNLFHCPPVRYRVFHNKMLFIRPQVESIDKNLIQRFYLACFHVSTTWSQSISLYFL